MFWDFLEIHPAWGIFTMLPAANDGESDEMDL
jgi:hypothetical protein